MVITVDLSTHDGEIAVESPEDCGKFHVEATGAPDGDWARLGHALVDAGVGRVEDDHAFVEVGAIRTLVAGRVGAAWADDFEKMLAYARTKGWLDEGGNAVQAHVEWR